MNQLEARRKWIEYLRNPELIRAVGYLESDLNRGCCCIGHGCNALNIPKTLQKGDVFYSFGEKSQRSVAPTEFVELVGLRTYLGDSSNREHLSLVELNDHMKAPFSQIADLLEAGITGHEESTYFTPLPQEEMPQ